MHVVRCGLHGFDETIGIDTEDLRVYWTLQSNVEGDAQTAYQIVLSTDPEISNAGKVIFDSGKISNNQQRNIPLILQNGLESTTFYYWLVTV